MLHANLTTWGDRSAGAGPPSTEPSEEPVVSSRQAVVKHSATHPTMVSTSINLREVSG